MPGSVTPARRSREDSDDDEEDFEVSVDGESPPGSNRSKRARLDDEASEQDEEEEGSSQDVGGVIETLSACVLIPVSGPSPAG